MTSRDFVKFRALNLALKTAILIEFYFLCDAWVAALSRFCTALSG